MNDEVVQTEFTDAEKATQLPTPAGYKILCAIPELSTKFFKDGVIERAHDKREQQATVVLFVVKVGPDAYKDKERYPSGPWCKEGDFVITRMYAGTRLTIHGKEFCVLNEDQVEAVVEDPRGVGRA